MVQEDKLVAILNDIAAPQSAEPWDNCGFQLRTGRTAYEKILVCLEVTKAVIEEAKQVGADLILAHHPMIFSSIRNVDDNNITGNYLIELIRAGISVFAIHTSFDKAAEGNNRYLARLLDLCDTEDMRTGPGPYDYMGCTGIFSREITLRQAVRIVCDALSLKESDIRVVGVPDGKVKHVALCTGAGAEFIAQMPQLGCDLYITGDVKYHDAQKAKELGLALIDAGHYGTEAIFTENAAAQLKERLAGAAVVLPSMIDLNPFVDLDDMREI